MDRWATVSCLRRVLTMLSDVLIILGLWLLHCLPAFLFPGCLCCGCEHCSDQFDSVFVTISNFTDGATSGAISGCPSGATCDYTSLNGTFELLKDSADPCQFNYTYPNTPDCTTSNTNLNALRCQIIQSSGIKAQVKKLYGGVNVDIIWQASLNDPCAGTYTTLSRISGPVGGASSTCFDARDTATCDLLEI